MKPYESPKPHAELYIGVEALVIDADPAVRQGLTALLSEAHIMVTAVAAWQPDVLRDKWFAVALVDLDSPKPGGGVATIAAIMAESPATKVIALTPRRAFDDAVACVRAGAIDVVQKVESAVPYLAQRVRAAAAQSAGVRELHDLYTDIQDTHETFLRVLMDAERRAVPAKSARAGTVEQNVDLLAVLVVDEADSLFLEVGASPVPGVAITHATSGGEALDRVSQEEFHYVLLAEDLSDLPTTTVVRTIRAQHPQLGVLTFRGPGVQGRLDVIEGNHARPLLVPFVDAQALVAQLAGFREAWLAKERKRRFTQAFRERHYDLVKRLAELRDRLDRAQGLPARGASRT